MEDVLLLSPTLFFLSSSSLSSSSLIQHSLADSINDRNIIDSNTTAADVVLVATTVTTTSTTKVDRVNNMNDNNNDDNFAPVILTPLDILTNMLMSLLIPTTTFTTD